MDTGPVQSRNTVQNEASSINLVKYIKAVIFVFFTLIIVVTNFFLEENLAKGTEVAEQKISSFDYGEDYLLGGNTGLRFNQNGETPEITIVKSQGDRHLFEMKKGNIWLNSKISTNKINILVGKVLLIPKFAELDLKVVDDHMELSVVNGDVYLGFLSDSAVFDNYIDEYSSIFINRFLVSRGNKVTIPLNKINDNIAPLLTSKLVKEFKLGIIPDDFMKEPWIEKNLLEDEEFIEKLKQRYISGILAKGASAKESFWGSFIYWAEENMLVAPDKKEKALFARLFESLDDAIYYSAKKDKEKMEESLSSFNVSVALIDPEIRQSDIFQGYLDKYLKDLLIFNVNDSQYNVYKDLIDEKFHQDNFYVMPLLWADIYDAIDKGDVEAEDTMDLFYNYFDKTFTNVDDRDFYLIYMTYYNQLFDNLFFHYPVFYEEGYFAIKDALEKNLLAQYDGQLKEELSQYFINNKIRFMKLLRKFFFDGELDVKETRDIFSRLFSEIDEIMPSEDAQVAVIDLFKTQLTDIEDFWGYLSSPEYHGISYGPNHKARFEMYIQEREKLWSLERMQEELLGKGPEKDIDVLDVIKQLEEYFKSNGDIGSIQVEELTDIEQRYVNINGVLGGFPFKGIFDRATESLNDVYVYDQLISDRPVKLASLLSLLTTKFSDLKDKEIVDEDNITLESDAQRTARFYVSKKVYEYGFNAELADISVVDEKNAIYRIKEVDVKDIPDVIVTFDIFMNKEESVGNVFLNVKDNPRVFTETYKIEELVDIIKAERDFVIEGTVAR